MFIADMLSNCLTQPRLGLPSLIVDNLNRGPFDALGESGADSLENGFFDSEPSGKR